MNEDVRALVSAGLITDEQAVEMMNKVRDLFFLNCACVRFCGATSTDSWWICERDDSRAV